MTEQARFAHSPLEKAFEKQTKTIQEERRKQVEAIEEHERQLVKFNAFTE